jgi:hypothetical protein
VREFSRGQARYLLAMDMSLLSAVPTAIVINYDLPEDIGNYKARADYGSLAVINFIKSARTELQKIRNIETIFKISIKELPALTDAALSGLYT